MSLKSFPSRRLLLGAAWLLVTVGCGKSSTDSSSSGGAAQTGGASQGGMVANGGAPDPGTGGNAVTNGGSPSGGSADGGSENGGATGSGGESVSGGPGAGGSPASGGAGGESGGSGSGSGSGGGADEDDLLAKFSFFVVSYPAIVRLSGKAEGFGGDLRFNQADGLSGADEICRQAAESGMEGAGQKQWRAFLSVTQGPDGGPVHARDRIGTGPWYDARGRLVAGSLVQLIDIRPRADPLIINDLPNELGEPNHYTGPGGLQLEPLDNHDVLTGSTTGGQLYSTDPADTCNDWTSTTATGTPRVGHSWPRTPSGGGGHWISIHEVPGCAAGVSFSFVSSGTNNCVGCLGGYGGFYCFALP